MFAPRKARAQIDPTLAAHSSPRRALRRPTARLAAQLCVGGDFEHRTQGLTLDDIGHGFEATLAPLLPSDPEVAELALLERACKMSSPPAMFA